MNTKADLGDWFLQALIAFALGVLAVYFMAKGTIPAPIPICP